MNAKDIGYTIAQIFLLVCLLAAGLLLVVAFDPLDAHGQELRIGVVPTVVTRHYTDRDLQDDHDGFGLLAEYQPEDSRFSVGGMFMRTDTWTVRTTPGLGLLRTCSPGYSTDTCSWRCAEGTSPSSPTGAPRSPGLPL